MVNQDKVQERQKALQEKWEKADSNECDQGLLLLTKSAAGRKYLWRLLQWGRVGTQPFTADPHITAFGCGELNVGQQILGHLIEVDPAGYLSILKERTDEQRLRDTDFARIGDPSYDPNVSGGTDDPDNSGDGDTPDEPTSYP